MRRAACLLASLVVIGATVDAQSRRAPTAAETKVLAQLIATMTPIFDRFADEDWRVKDNDFPAEPSRFSISIHALVPMDDCFGGARTWRVAEGSPRFNTRLKPLIDRAQTLTDSLVAKYKAGQDTPADAKALEALHQQIKSLSDVTMDVCANRPNVEAAALHSSQPSVVPGVIAHKVDGDACGDATVSCYLLVYGDWKTARLNAPDKLYDFHWVHPAASPYIENVVIRLYGADDRIQEMLKAVDWTRVNEALTK